MILTKEIAFQIFKELWTFLAETGLHKEDWPELGKYDGGWCNYCPFCVYNMEQRVRGDADCVHCPLDVFKSGCYSDDLSFFNWDTAITVKDRKKYAKLFLEEVLPLEEEWLKSKSKQSTI